MPSFPGFTRHSNRSQPQQVESPKSQRAPGATLSSQTAVTSQEDNGYDLAIQPQSYSGPPDDIEQHYPPTPVDLSSSNQQYNELDEGGELQSVPDHHRYSRLFHNQSSQEEPHQQQNTSINDPAQAQIVPGRFKRTNSGPLPSKPEPVPELPKKSKSRGLFGGWSSKSVRTQAPSQGQQSQGLSRRVSKRQIDRPDLRLQQNSSIERLQQGEWHPPATSSSTLPSQTEDEYDPFLIREDQAEHTQHPDPRQGLSVRIVDDNHPLQPQSQQYQQYHDQQQLHSPQQYSPNPQKYHQFSEHTSPTSPEKAAYNQQQQHTPSQQQHTPSQQQQYQQQQSYSNQLPQPYCQQNPEVPSQLSRDSPNEQEERRPGSVQSQQQGYQQQSHQQYPSRIDSAAGSQSHGPSPPQHQHQQNMPPSSVQGQQVRKSMETNKGLSPEIVRGGAAAGFAGQFSPAPAQGGQGQSQVNLQNPLPPVPGQPDRMERTPTAYRSSGLRTEFSTASDNQGRNTPPPDTRELNEMDKLLIKYKKVKGLYFDKSAQVEALQNTLANQRLSQSRTSLDDSGYSERFTRLDGAIKEVAFAIRKEWSSLPPWIAPVANGDAIKTGTKEMTAIGRAVISRWLNEEIWGKTFHPGLEIPLSEELKRIEKKIRFFGPPAATAADLETLTSKIVQWRLTTMEGLAHRLNEAHAHQVKGEFVQIKVAELTGFLLNHLQEEAAMNIQGNMTSIVELAVGIASHIPLESRDIVITYPMPGDAVQQYMKAEPGLPPFEDYLLEAFIGDDILGRTDQSEEKEKSDKLKKHKGKNEKKGQPSGTTQEQQQEMERRKEDAKNKIRFAGFVGVEVRGRQWLYNPPVWTIG